jgi:hypothetical protein
MGDTVAYIEPDETEDVAPVMGKPKSDPRPQPPKYIKGKVALPKKTKPAEPIPEEKIQDVRIMGECVVPYEYEKPKG